MSYAITVVATLVVTAATCFFVGFDLPVALFGLSALSLPLGLLSALGSNLGKIALVAAVTATTLIGVVWVHDVYVYYRTIGSVAWNKVTSATWSDAYQLLPPIVQVNPFAGYAAGANTTWLAEVDELAHRRLRGTAQYLKCGVPPQPGEPEIVRVFPAWPLAWDASFRLLARGGFLVSSEIKEGKVTFVEVESRLGEEYRLRNPWGDECLLTETDGASHPLSGELLRFPTKPGKRYRLAPR